MVEVTQQPPKNREPMCTRCGLQAKLVQEILDSVRGSIVRLFRCECGDQAWEDVGRKKQPLLRDDDLIDLAPSARDITSALLPAKDPATRLVGV